jgi:hypothetical protein
LGRKLYKTRISSLENAGAFPGSFPHIGVPDTAVGEALGDTVKDGDGAGAGNVRL